MGASLDRLLGIASPALTQEDGQLIEEVLASTYPIVIELKQLLLDRNGFFAFESALHVFPIGVTTQGYDFTAWNSEQLWRSEYSNIAGECLFFAEDIFGEQFCVLDEHICRFDPETGETKIIASNLEDWACVILDDYAVETGYNLAHEWQKSNGVLRANERLVPITPFVLGGAYSLENLHALDAVKGMRFRTNIARQIHDLPDGTSINLKVIE